MVVARPPIEYRADTERLAQHMAHHVLRPHAFGWTLIVRATGGMDVMVSGVPTQTGRINPSPETDVQTAPACGVNDRFCLRSVFGPASADRGELAGWKPHGLSVRPIDLFLEKEVRRQTFPSSRIDVAGLVFDD